MTLEEFKALSEGTTLHDKDGGYYPEDNELTKCGLSIEWSTGGVTGGSCWHEGGHESFGGESEPEFAALDTLLEKTVPNISFLKYKIIQREAVKEYEYCYNEYYGNYTNYTVNWVDVEELYHLLVREELIDA